MIRRTLLIVNKLGLHARAAATFVAAASQFECAVTLIQGNAEVNGKSIMGIMMLAAGQGTQLELVTDGADEDKAADAICALVEGRFGEDA